MTDEYANQPPISEWKFVDQLKSPLHTHIAWRRTTARPGEASLKDGVALEFAFPDPAGALDTAYDDFHRFLAAGAIGTNGAYRIVTARAPTSTTEEHVLDVGEDTCRILANDTEGIRRGLVFLEDQITSSGGPFVRLGQTTRTPFIRTRVSRCFFGPIKRPPINRDELLDDVDYYPDEYLNRLAHEGVNGLWLSIEFRDFPSRFFPNHGRDSERRLAKLRRTVAQCARYGIGVYLYCNEPCGFGNDYSLLPASELEGNPWFAGHQAGGVTYFCTSSPEGLQYVEECTHYIFSHVPGLAGMIAITHGEHPTTCYCYDRQFLRNNCPRCSSAQAVGGISRHAIRLNAGDQARGATGAVHLLALHPPHLGNGRSLDPGGQVRDLPADRGAHPPGRDDADEFRVQWHGEAARKRVPGL